MNSIGLCVCEVCGSQSPDHAGWFSVAGTGSRMEVLPWSDELRGRSDCRHACCGDHVQRLVFSTALLGFARNTLPFSLPQRGGWNPASLELPTEPTKTKEQSIQELLGEIDSVLGGPTADDEDEQAAFDA